jgi:hypothetical protein
MRSIVRSTVQRIKKKKAPGSPAASIVASTTIYTFAVILLQQISSIAQSL